MPFVVAIWVISGVLILARGKVLPASKRPTGPPTHILDSLRDRKIWRTLATSSLAQLGTDLFQFYLPIHGHAAGLSATAIGAVLAAFAVASFAVRSVLTRLVTRFGEERLLAYRFISAPWVSCWCRSATVRCRSRWYRSFSAAAWAAASRSP